MSEIVERYPPQGLPSGVTIDSGTLAARPAAGTADSYYWATDIETLFRDTGAAWEVMAAQWYERYHPTVFGNISGAITATSSAVGMVYYSAIEILRAITIDRIGIRCATGGNGNFYLAIYDSVAEAPVNRLAVSASTAHVASTKLQLAINPATLQLTPGYYFLAVESSVIIDNFVSDRFSPNAESPANINHGPSWYQEALGAYAVPPAVATPAFLSDYNRCYFMWVRAVSVP